MQRMIEEIGQAVDALDQSGRVIVAIDGRCASGKTTLSKRLEEALDATVFHMDDYFLRPEQRTPERLDTPGGNVDYERFTDEILRPLIVGEEQIVYRPYDCSCQALAEPILVKPKRIVIIEGAYACHPTLREHYDLKIFITVSGEEQMRRIVARNGAQRAEVFRDRWIPLEEAYFAACQTENCCDLGFDNTNA